MLGIYQTAAISALVAGAWAGTANANVLLFAAFPPSYGRQHFVTPSFVDFNGANSGGRLLNFTTSVANQRVVIIFESTCMTTDPTQGLSVKVLVDPAGSAGEFAAPPTSSTVFSNGVDFCHKDFGTEQSVSHIVRASVTASARLAQAGAHTVRVQVTPTSDPADALPEGWLDTASLTVLD